MEQLKFTIKEIITVGVIVLGLAGTYFKNQFDIDYLKKQDTENKASISGIKKEIVVLSRLPSQVGSLQIKLESNARMLGVIHDGLIAKGIIAPRTR